MDIYFYKLDINNPPTEIKDWYNEIDNIKKQKIDSIQNQNVRLTKITSDHLARQAVAQFLNKSTSEIKFCYGKHNKPLLPNNDAYFNVSHSGNYIVCCVDNLPCGIDIEVLRKTNQNTAKRFCTNAELEYIENSENKDIALLEIWTKKEAYFKSFGLGIATCLNALDTLKTNGFSTEICNDYILTVYSENDSEKNIIYL